MPPQQQVSYRPAGSDGQDASDYRCISGRGADLLVKALIGNGVTDLFGVPGDTGIVLYDALYHCAAEIRHILARDERHAAAMADAYARVTGRIGTVEVSSGGGTSYVVGGLGEAFAAAVPILVVTSDIHRDSRGSGALTEIDQEALFAAVTKHTLVVSRAQDVPAAVSEALKAATTGRPAPVALIVPEDVLDEHAEAELPPTQDRLQVPRKRPSAPANGIAAAGRLLSRSQRPALLVGGGVHVSRAYAAVQEFAECLGAGVATTIHGKGAIADSNTWALGVAGNNGGADPASSYLAESDTVVVIGSRANATDTDSYSAPPRSANVIAIDIDPSRASNNYPNAMVLDGDADVILHQLIAELTPVTADGVDNRRQDIARRRDKGVTVDPRPIPTGKLLVDDVIDELAKVFSDVDPLVAVDPGTPTPAVAHRWPVRRAGRSIVIPRGHGPMGYAIPAAVGAAVAEPGRPVLALTADGSFAMSCGELETIARLQLPIIAVQFTNDSMGWIKMLQHLYEGGRYFSVDPGPIDATAVARACGLNAARPTTIEALGDHVRSARAAGGGMYLDVDVAHMIDIVPQVPAWHRALAGDRTRPVY